MSKRSVYDYLQKVGMSPTGALAAMGNMGEESNLEACRVQGDFQADRWPSKDYAHRVDNGILDEEVYARDGKGWGLVQYTWSGYKKGLLKLCRGRNVSIADEVAQIDYLVSILKSEFVGLWSFLCSCGEDQLYEATSRFCREFERPAYNNVDARYRIAMNLRNEMGSVVENANNNVVLDNGGFDRYWPPRMLCKGMNGPDVEALQGLLYSHGYTYGNTKGVFGDSTESAVRKYQKENRDVDGNKLDVDGVVGKKTWGSLVKM